ncbi:uncharacterized protein LOC117784637 [Drosophila innubila]|uniref:uncharacterized protein LOC117784637 n=1 Tax=Drosophila innubila TaxID=198719 RepID=UPI00148B5F09|nr:uncharacterized protein LOC117784637 [Drosophila innubila]XP_034478324.1 uncharacterized protein LOC117784637 [Drosophila innubila]
MDRSLDSIGSCSLDVDADSSDISDTSGSLNFPTPISVKDITREFTANIRERCTITTTSYVKLDTRTAGLGGGGGGGGATAGAGAADRVADNTISNNSCQLVVDVEKKPSYLNLACCVNGYSNLTTYDSKIRQDINKSREVSPIRPSTSSLQYCKRSNSLAAPVLHQMPLTQQPIKETNNNHKHSNHNNHYPNHNPINPVLMEQSEQLYCNGTGSSFIQQRVERLYGPGALAQVFYSPKKHSASLSPVPSSNSNSRTPQNSSELSRKFKQLSPSKNYTEFHKKLHNNCTPRRETELSTNLHNGDVDLPVFRHLSHEFRAQLPTVSPKRSVTRVSPAPEVPLPQSVINGSKLKLDVDLDVVDHEPIQVDQLRSEEYNSTTKLTSTVEDTLVAPVAPTSTCQPAPEKDGNYFLKILKEEQVRLLALAAVAEKYIDALTNNPDITEDTFGLLRSASGKARLLASQKMKQFEGLCHNNLNRSPEDAFPTTLDDLQGFWDMVYLQVTHVDSIFADIEQLKSNDWQSVKALDTVPVMKASKSSKTGPLKTRATGAATANGSKTAAASNSVAQMKREAQRKQLMEMKRLRREALAAATVSNDANVAVLVEDVAVVGVGVGDNNAALQTTIGDTVNSAVKNSS